MTVIVSPDAAFDLARLRAFLADKNPAAAGHAAALLTHAIQSLEQFPNRGRPSGRSGVRELVVQFGRSAYVLRYAHRTETQELIVLRVWHAREKRA